MPRPSPDPVSEVREATYCEACTSLYNEDVRRSGAAWEFTPVRHVEGEHLYARLATPADPEERESFTRLGTLAGDHAYLVRMLGIIAATDPDNAEDVATAIETAKLAIATTPERFAVFDTGAEERLRAALDDPNDCPICSGMCAAGHPDPAAAAEEHRRVERVLAAARSKGVRFGDGPDDIDTGELASDILSALGHWTEFAAGYEWGRRSVLSGGSVDEEATSDSRKGDAMKETG